jgi:fibronectin-binding autotransporter adhesin
MFPNSLFMKIRQPNHTRFLTLCLLGILAFGPFARAEKIWTNTVSGLWSDGTNWTGHTPPDITSFIRITNDNSKTVTIDALTPATELTVQMLTLNAPPGATNTLLLTDVGTNNPLVFQTGLELQDGAALRITNSALAVQLTNDHVNIDGSLTLDSGLIDFGDLSVTTRVGRATSGLLAINSGLMSAGTMTVGGLTNSTGNVHINGGTLNVAGSLSVGRNLSTIGTFSLLGGELNVSNDDTRVGDSGIGYMTVSNATASVTNLQVGRDALSGGTLTLGDGSLVQTFSDVSIARFSGCTGLVSVLGGQLVANGYKIFVGRGGDGELILSNGTLQAASLLVAADTTNSIGATGTMTVTGGSLMLSSNLLVGSSLLSTGQVFMSGGSLIVTNGAHTGNLAIPSGDLVMSGGTITADNLSLTNAAGQFAFHGGTLITKGTAVANGSSFVVGDGVAPAILHLDGGTHSFANGLIISSNATLEGCGTVLGSIINHGTISTNCGAVVQFSIHFQGRLGATNSISVSSVSGLSYTLEFKSLFSDPSWTPVLPATPGTGGTIILQDATATGPARAYRVRAQ